MINTPSDKSEENVTNDQASDENDTMAAVPRRRIQDGIKSKNPSGKMNLNRRRENSERRTNKDSDYKGPSRRFTIDRRVATKDRRKPD
jgi:hypothetical protein